MFGWWSFNSARLPSGPHSGRRPSLRVRVATGSSRESKVKWMKGIFSLEIHLVTRDHKWKFSIWLEIDQFCKLPVIGNNARENKMKVFCSVNILLIFAENRMNAKWKLSPLLTFVLNSASSQQAELAQEKVKWKCFYSSSVVQFCKLKRK
jgi:hypothetical protein